MIPYMLLRLKQKLEGKEPESKQTKPISKVSKKRQKQNQEYARVSRPKWIGKQCGIRSPVCTGKAQGWNHAGGKETIEKLLDVENGQPACNACNSYIEQHHAWAVEKGFRTKRNTATTRYENTYKRK